MIMIRIMIMMIKMVMMNHLDPPEQFSHIGLKMVKCWDKIYKILKKAKTHLVFGPNCPKTNEN